MIQLIDPYNLKASMADDSSPGGRWRVHWAGCVGGPCDPSTRVADDYMPHERAYPCTMQQHNKRTEDSALLRLDFRLRVILYMI